MDKTDAISLFLAYLSMLIMTTIFLADFSNHDVEPIYDFILLIGAYTYFLLFVNHWKNNKNF